MKVKIYIEGGGDGRDLRKACRKGFTHFFENAGFAGHMPSVKACGSRGKAFGYFSTALRDADSSDFIALLVDSEAPVTSGASPWEHLKNRPGDNWDCPAGASDENAHLMVQCMESWFLADKKALSTYFGKDFGEKSLPLNLMVEEIPKEDIYDKLKSATKHTQKGAYCKGPHSFEILERIDPEKVAAAAPYCKRLLETLHLKALQ